MNSPSLARRSHRRLRGAIDDAARFEQSSGVPCLFVVLAAFFPRLVLFLLWLFSPGFFSPEFDGQFLWPVLGFLFLPFTTLMYAAFYDPAMGGLAGPGVIAVVVAVLLDLGIVGGGASSRV